MGVGWWSRPSLSSALWHSALWPLILCPLADRKHPADVYVVAKKSEDCDLECMNKFVTGVT